MLQSREQRHKSLRSISLGTLWRVLRYPFIILAALLIPRLMGPTTYGRFALFLSVYMILDMATDIGFTQVFGRFLPEMVRRTPQRAAHLLHELLIVGIVITVAVSLVVGIPLYASGQFEMKPFWWGLMMVLLLASKVKGTLFAFLYGLNDIARFSARELLRSILTLVLVVVLHHYYGLTGALVALVLNEALLLVVAVVWTRTFLFQAIAPIRWTDLKPYLAFGIAFYVPMLCWGLLQRAGNPLIEILTGHEEQIGFFDVANQYLTLTATFLGLIFTTLLPSLTHMHLDNQAEDIGRWQNTVMTYCAMVFVLTAHALVLVGRDVITICLGGVFAPIYPCALILTPAIPAMLFVYAGMNYTILREEPRVFTYSVLSGLIIMVSAALFCIPRWFSLGAAMASVLGYFTSAVVIVIHYRSEFAPMLAGFRKVLLLGILLIPLHFTTFGFAGRMGMLLMSCIAFCALAIRLRVIDISFVYKLRAAHKERD